MIKYKQLLLEKDEVVVLKQKIGQSLNINTI